MMAKQEKARDGLVIRVVKVLAKYDTERTDRLFLVLLLLFELVVSIAIVRFISYTEIDWVAYMQQCEQCWGEQQERDYTKMYGPTGPLVYPAGFLYLFGALRQLTNNGQDVRQAQYYFIGFYLVTQATVLSLYQIPIKSLRVRQSQQQGSKNADVSKFATVLSIWSWRIAMVLTCLSKRLHSIYMLRLFNDGTTMMLFYLSLYLFTRTSSSRPSSSVFWYFGCVMFSLAVSVKMNILLFAPGLLLLLLQSSSSLFSDVIIRKLLLCCALPQLLLGAPFLLRHPVSYIRKAFEFDRVFFYKWTVNLKVKSLLICLCRLFDYSCSHLLSFICIWRWQFLPEDIFLAKRLSILLLGLHLSFLAYFAVKWLQRDTSIGSSWFASGKIPRLSPHYIVYTMLVSNFVGIAFSRTLHYQFYSWYYHAIPYLLWTSLPESSANDKNVKSLVSRYVFFNLWRLVVVVGLEIAFLTFPATSSSSILLQICHLVVLFQIRCPQHIYLTEKNVAKREAVKKRV